MANVHPPGKGFMGWLGRQVGHVTKAVKAEVGSKIVYRESKMMEVSHPDDPSLTLRRTTTDELVREQGLRKTGE